MIKTCVFTNSVFDYTEEFSYDAMGNRTQRRKSVQGNPFIDTDYTYNAGSHLTSDVTSGVQTDYSYDDNGNMITKQTGADLTTYGFDSLDRMTTATVNGVTSSYSYDVYGKRIRKNLTQSGQGITEYWHQGDNVIAEVNPAPQAVTATYNTPFLDENVSMNRNGQVYYYMQDGLGSVRQLLNSLTQEPLNSYDYNAWGEAVSGQELVQNPYRYTGREWDNETSQYNYRSRYYSPATGRFNQKDRIGFQGGFNLYGYIENRSVNFVDPFGMGPRELDQWCKDERAVQRNDERRAKGLPTEEEMLAEAEERAVKYLAGQTVEGVEWLAETAYDTVKAGATESAKWALGIKHYKAIEYYYKYGFSAAASGTADIVEDKVKAVVDLPGKIAGGIQNDSKEIKRQLENDNPYEAGKAIYTVVTDANNNLITAHPGKP